MSKIWEVWDALYDSNSDKAGAHSYALPYGLVLSALAAEGKPISILEIGVSMWPPGSLRAWAGLSFVERVVGLDIEDYNAELLPNAHFHKMNAYQMETVHFLEEEYPPFDLIIDDGSHEVVDMRFVIDVYPRLCKKNGLVVVEDILPQYIETMREGAQIMSLAENTYAKWDSVMAFKRGEAA